VRVQKFTFLFVFFLATTCFGSLVHANAVLSCLDRLESVSKKVGDVLPLRSTVRLKIADNLRKFRGSTKLRVDEQGESLVAELDDLIMSDNTKGAIALVNQTMTNVERSYRKLQATNEARDAFKDLKVEIASMEGDTIPAEVLSRLATIMNSLVENLRADFTYLTKDQRPIKKLRKLGEILNQAVLPDAEAISKADIAARLELCETWLDSISAYLKSSMGKNIADYIPIVAYLETHDFKNRFDANIDALAYAKPAPVLENVAAKIYDVGAEPGKSAHQLTDAEKKWTEGVATVRANVGMTNAYETLHPSLIPGPPPLRDIMTEIYGSYEIQRDFSKTVLRKEVKGTLMQLGWDTLVLWPKIIGRIPKGWRVRKIDGMKEAFATIFEGFVRLRRDEYLADVKEFVDKSLSLKAELPSGDATLQHEWMNSRMEYLAEKFGDSNFGQAYLECFARDANGQSRSLLREIYAAEINSSEKLFTAMLDPLRLALEAADKKPPITISNSRIRPTYYVATVIDITLAILAYSYSPAVLNQADDDTKKLAEAVKSGEEPPPAAQAAPPPAVNEPAHPAEQAPAAEQAPPQPQPEEQPVEELIR
jgi:hypothetical protein